MDLSDAMRLAVNMARSFPATPITISQTGDWIEAVEDLERQLQRAEERADRNAAAVDAAERLRQEVEATIQRMRDWREMEPHDLWGEPFEQLHNYVLDWADDLAAALEEQEPE